MKIAMIAITTSNSTNVNARRQDVFMMTSDFSMTREMIEQSEITNWAAGQAIPKAENSSDDSFRRATSTTDEDFVC